MGKIDITFGKKLAKYGAIDFNACYNCGTCTAVCSLSDENDSFPREMQRLSVLGMKDDIKMSLKPWLCYYCGECTMHCPRDAKPGELMMSLRRWLTTQYDWTRLSGMLYRSLTFTLIALILVFIGVLVFAGIVNFEAETMLHIGHYFEMTAVLTVFLAILLPNLLRMWYFTIIKPKIKSSFKNYITALSDLLVHMFTQKRTKDCESGLNFRWLEHFVLVLSYLSLLFTTVFLNWLGTNNIFIIVLGYIESFLIFLITTDFVKDRIKKNIELSKFSHHSDWLFVIWLFLMGLTAFLVRFFIDLKLIETQSWVYIIHLVVLAQWALIIVPFGKWTHFLYRSFAMYFQKIKTLSVK